MPKCHICKGKGMVESTNRKGVCYYCNGTGMRNRKYSRYSDNENNY